MTRNVECTTAVIRASCLALDCVPFGEKRNWARFLCGDPARSRSQSVHRSVAPFPTRQKEKGSGEPAQSLDICQQRLLVAERASCQMLHSRSKTHVTGAGGSAWGCARDPAHSFSSSLQGLIAASFVRATECVFTRLLACRLCVGDLHCLYVTCASVAASISESTFLWSLPNLPGIHGLSAGSALGDGTFFGHLHQVYFAVHTWRVKSSDGKWIRCIELLQGRHTASPSSRQRAAIAMCTYFDNKRWGRSHHVVGSTHLHALWRARGGRTTRHRS